MLTVSATQSCFQRNVKQFCMSLLFDLLAFVASTANIVHPSFPQLLAGETLIREYVCEYTVTCNYNKIVTF